MTISFRPRLLCAVALVFTALPPLAHAAPYVCSARAYGAKPDGVTLNTAALQRAINACALRRGTVVLRGGVFVTAPLTLKSHVTLTIAKGATLLGAPDHAAYAPRQEFGYKAVTPLLSAAHAAYITINGGGTIDGNGASWWAQARAEHDHGIIGEGLLRPRLIVFDHCRHIRMSGVTVQNSAFWQIVPYYTDDISFRNMRILADPHSPNTDAIDPFSSSNVVIDHVYADVGDDNVAIKSGAINSPGPDSPSRNITITHCEFHHGHGVSVGSELAGGANNIRVDDVKFIGTDNGIRVKANRDRGHDVSHLSFRNITMQDVKTAILISEYYPKMLPEPGDKPQPMTRLTPNFHDIVIENVTATGSENAGVIIGLPESHVTDIHLKNVNITAAKNFFIANAEVDAQDFVVKAASGTGIDVDASAKLMATDTKQ
jgi:polygalacturonase